MNWCNGVFTLTIEPLIANDRACWPAADAEEVKWLRKRGPARGDKTCDPDGQAE